VTTADAAESKPKPKQSLKSAPQLSVSSHRSANDNHKSNLMRLNDDQTPRIVGK
jgi:hypothetical protein